MKFCYSNDMNNNGVYYLNIKLPQLIVKYMQCRVPIKSSFIWFFRLQFHISRCSDALQWKQGRVIFLYIYYLSFSFLSSYLSCYSHRFTDTGLFVSIASSFNFIRWRSWYFNSQLKLLTGLENELVTKYDQAFYLNK